MQSARKKVRFNYHDYLLFPADKRYEIIDGDSHMVPAPLTQHQKISRNLYELMWNHVKKNRLGEVLYAPVDVVLSHEDIVQPDILFISAGRLKILTEENVQGAPDLVVEIVSPSSKKWDTDIKVKLYEKFGVREYWIVDPDAASVEVRQLTDNGLEVYRTFSRGTHLNSPILPKFKFLVDDIF